MAMIYVASKTKHAEMWRSLRAEGAPIISTWIDEAGQGETSDWSDLWRRCVSEAAGASALVLYAEPTDFLKGALVEVGAALAHGVPVFVVGECASIGSFRAHPLVRPAGSVSDAIEMAVGR